MGDNKVSDQDESIEVEPVCRDGNETQQGRQKMAEHGYENSKQNGEQ